MATDDAYETCGPQWVDLQAMTPNHDSFSGDDFFNRSHDSLEAMPIKHKPRTRKSVRVQNLKNSSTIETPKAKNVNEPKSQSTFMNDIDNICITPLKLTSPNSTNQDGVLEEYHVNEILNDALAKLTLVSSLKKRLKPQSMNKTVCPRIAITPNTPIRKSLRLSKSLNENSTNNQNQVPNNQTPVDDVKNARRSVRIQNVKTTEGVNTPNKAAKKQSIMEIEKENRKISPKTSANCKNVDKKMIETLKNGKENIESGSNIVHNKKNSRASVCVDSLQNTVTSSIKKKVRLSRSMHQSTPINRIPVFNLRTSPCTMNLKPSKIPVYKLDDEVDICQTAVENVHEKSKYEECQVILQKIDSENKLFNCTNESTVEIKKSDKPVEVINVIDSEEDIYNEAELPNINEVKEDQVINIPDMEPQTVANIQVDNEEFQPFDQFSKTLDEEDENNYKVFKARCVEEGLRAKKKPNVLVGQARRNSIQMKNIVNRRRPNKYISLAEGVKAFQRSTPTRFHTLSKKSDKNVQPAPNQKHTHVPKRTIPVSPNWHSRPRTKVVPQQQNAVNSKPKSFVHPVPTRILKAPEPLKEVPKKPLTVPKPFKLSQSNKNTVPSTSSSSTASSATTSKTKVSKPHKAMVRNVPNYEGEIQEILHFSIPITKNLNVSSKLEPKKKTTQPVPFHFEERSKKLLNQKEHKLKKLQEEKVKSKVQPAPTKKSTHEEHKDQKNQKGNLEKTDSHIKVVPFSFEERDKNMAKKKEELRKKIEAQERKARIFRASPVPQFKPVTVKFPSRENLNANRMISKAKSAENLKSKNNLPVVSMPRGMSAENLIKNSKKDMKNIIQAQQSSVSGSSTSLNVAGNNQENQMPNMPILKPKLKPLSIELHSEKRARLRREYEEKVKLKMEQEEARRKREEELKIAREQEELAKMRRQAEHKAKPVPHYKPLTIVKSSRPVTEPQSPAWTRSRR